MAGECGSSWIFRASYYSHDTSTGQRVNQYAREQAAYVRTDPTYQESVFRYNRSGPQVGGNFDFTHTVETWGQGESIRPYGEWLFPYRAGATPYGPWGNPQGPWTTPFGAWVNPYGLGRLPYGSMSPGPYATPMSPGQAGPPAGRTPPPPTPMPPDGG
jgi:hypothetical protein